MTLSVDIARKAFPTPDGEKIIAFDCYTEDIFVHDAATLARCRAAKHDLREAKNW